MKRLLLAGVLSLIGAAPSFAQVTSINAVGYANVVVPSGFSMICNPLAGQDQSLAALFPNAPALTVVYKFNGLTFNQSIRTAGGTWTAVGGTNMTLSPGEGAFIKNPGSDFTNTFVGEVLTGTLVNPIPTGFSIRSSQVPQSGGVTSVLGLIAGALDVVYLFNPDTQLYTQRIFNGSAWLPSEPTVQVGQAFWILRHSNNGATTWTRNFSIN